VNSRRVLKRKRSSAVPREHWTWQSTSGTHWLHQSCQIFFVLANKDKLRESDIGFAWLISKRLKGRTRWEFFRLQVRFCPLTFTRTGAERLQHVSHSDNGPLRFPSLHKIDEPMLQVPQQPECKKCLAITSSFSTRLSDPPVLKACRIRNFFVSLIKRQHSRKLPDEQ
jgi:hypothetical protein